MYGVMYKSENSDFFRKHGLGKYTTVFTGKTSKYKKVCFRFAVKMNKHLKKFHTEVYGKNIYFVREVTEHETKIPF